MNIRPITTITSFNRFQNNIDNKLQEQSLETQSSGQQPQKTAVSNPLQIMPRFNDHLLSFGARVDKGLERFYETNKDRMPITVSRYVESLEDKTALTPLEAQKRAFNRLEDAKTAQDIKKAYSNKELFTDLINPSDSKAKRGILNAVKENEELLALDGKGILKSDENLTVYLVKKVFLEGKTVEEINKDLENDLEPDFKADFKFKNKDKDKETPYIYGSTLSALGIKTPQFEYQQSLRYTKDGYSDFVGEKISKGQREFWDTMAPEERTARAKKSVEKFEIWWNSHSRNEILDMIADQQTELDMLKDFKKLQRAEAKQNGTNPEPKAETAETTDTPRKGTKVGSEKLGQDELFIKWASNNLKLFEANLSEADKDTLHLKRMTRLVQRWAGMTPAEKTDYISKMKSGAEPLRYAMIDAWNQNKDLVKDLSSFLKENQSIYKPSELLYSTEEFSTLQSQLMSQFWRENPEYAIKLGNSIRVSHDKVQTAISRGTFEELKKQIERDKAQRISELNKFKAEKTQTSEPSQNIQSDYIKEFKAAYEKAIPEQLKNMPKDYLNDFYNMVESENDKESIIAWTKHLKGEMLTSQESQCLKKIMDNEPIKAKRMNRAIEAAVAAVLYDCSRYPDVYMMSNSDVRHVLGNIEKGATFIDIKSLKLNTNFRFPVQNNKINKTKIAELYKTYKQDLTENEVDEILHYYFEVNGDEQELRDYIKTYGKSALILFSDRSQHSKEIKRSFYEKFKANTPNLGKGAFIASTFDKPQAYEINQRLSKLQVPYSKKFNFVPTEFMENYFREMSKEFRRQNEGTGFLDTFESFCCTKRTDPKARGKLAVFPKNKMLTENQLKTLAMEQALADVLYEATGNSDVYTMQFEELCDNIEIFSLINKFPSEERTYPSLTIAKPISLIANKKVNTQPINKLYHEYMSELKDWMNNEVAKTGNAKLDDLCCILNPYEEAEFKDDAIERRIRVYEMNLA